MVKIAMRKSMSRKESDDMMRKCKKLQDKYKYDWVQWAIVAQNCDDEDPNRECYFALAAGMMEGV